MMPSLPIGVFDSGVGGLTVYRALREKMPHEDIIYLGDTARLPYGTKSPETVANYAEQVTERLLKEKIKMLLVACNTATALAMPSLRKRFPDLPCLGVIEPGAGTAVQSTHNGKIVVMATEGTVRSGAYQEAIKRRKPEAEVEGLACNVLVSLAEEGWADCAETKAVMARYLSQIQMKDYDTVVLGCTHFPLLIPVIRALLPPKVTLVDSAETTAEAVSSYLIGRGLAKLGHEPGQDMFLVTDGPERFRLMAERFLDGKVIEKVELTLI